MRSNRDSDTVTMGLTRSRIPRDHWLRRIERLDPVADAAQVYGITARHEFPWDMNQALSFALFRTYAVPSIGVLLHDTGQFTQATQKRYDDTGLLLDAILEHGFDSDTGKAAVRRINRMHGMYAISNDDLRYVPCTFVVTPERWLDRFGWRPLSAGERIAATLDEVGGSRRRVRRLEDALIPVRVETRRARASIDRFPRR